jgi:mannose-6-phosphate isomerase-like protein (cupin superfamily)
MSTSNAVTHRSARQYAAWKIQPADTNYFAFTVDPLQDATSFVQVIEIFEVGGKTPPNAHVAADEHFYVLHGEGIALCNGAKIQVKPGDSFLVRPGNEHVVENTGNTRLYCLTTMVPDEAFAQLIKNGIPWKLDEADYAVLEGHKP